MINNNNNTKPEVITTCIGPAVKYAQVVPESFRPFVESSPDGKSPKQLGVKLDAGKIPVFRGLIEYFPNACMAVAEVSQAGANKYEWKGWASVENGKVRYTDALVRHLIKESTEGDIDPDFGLLHAAHLAWSAMARLELILLEKKNDQTISSPV